MCFRDPVPNVLDVATSDVCAGSLDVLNLSRHASWINIDYADQ